MTSVDPDTIIIYWTLLFLQSVVFVDYKFYSFLFREFCMTSGTFLTPTKRTVSIIYFYLTRICYMFGCLCTMTRENNCVSAVKNSSNSSRYFKELPDSFSLMLVHQHRNMKQIKVKGTVHPRRGHESLEEDMSNSTVSLTAVLDGVGGQRHTPATLQAGKTRYPLYRRLGGPQGRSGQVRKISPPSGIDPRTVQPAAILYTGWAIPAHETCSSYASDIFI
jgi:hypothetical protein